VETNKTKLKKLNQHTNDLEGLKMLEDLYLTKFWRTEEKSATWHCCHSMVGVTNGGSFVDWKFKNNE